MRHIPILQTAGLLSFPGLHYQLNVNQIDELYLSIATFDVMTLVSAPSTLGYVIFSMLGEQSLPSYFRHAGCVQVGQENEVMAEGSGRGGWDRAS